MRRSFPHDAPAEGSAPAVSAAVPAEDAEDAVPDGIRFLGVRDPNRVEDPAVGDVVICGTEGGKALVACAWLGEGQGCRPDTGWKAVAWPTARAIEEYLHAAGISGSVGRKGDLVVWRDGSPATRHRTT